jgi:HTH-type transcriptional regulator, competence development regulator
MVQNCVKNASRKPKIRTQRPSEGSPYSLFYQYVRSAMSLQNFIGSFTPCVSPEGQKMANLIPRPHRPRLDTSQRRFGAYIREVRLSKRMTLRACAQAVGLAAGHLSNIEHARVTPPGEPVVVKLAEVLDIPVGALLARAGRLSPADLQRFWASPLIPSLVMSSTGWTQEEATIFQEMILASVI